MKKVVLLGKRIKNNPNSSFLIIENFNIDEEAFKNDKDIILKESDVFDNILFSLSWRAFHDKETIIFPNSQQDEFSDETQIYRINQEKVNKLKQKVDLKELVYFEKDGNFVEEKIEYFVLYSSEKEEYREHLIDRLLKNIGLLLCSLEGIEDIYPFMIHDKIKKWDNEECKKALHQKIVEMDIPISVLINNNIDLNLFIPIEAFLKELEELPSSNKTLKNEYILTTEPKNCDCSLESGIADDQNHFDHHKKEHSHYPAPANNENIKAISNKKVAISHIDADTFIGILRMEGLELPKIDLDLVEKIDLNGSSVLDDLHNDTYYYMVGVGEFARKINFPKIEKDKDINVTKYIHELIQNSYSFIGLGKKATNKAITDFDNARTHYAKRVGLLKINANMSIDPSMGYKKGMDIVIIYREHYKSISIYVNPKIDFVARQVWAGIEFGGHEKACGSPRGVEYTFQNAIDVFTQVSWTYFETK